ncbi:MAG: hypothetical protein K2F90_03105 [Clostridiales bacterium]|nr:hypothetical protein [Clostridiales bacterium]
MVCRKFGTVINRVLALIAILATVMLSWSALYFATKKYAHADEVQAQAQTQPSHDDVFGASHTNSKPFSLSDEEIVFVEPGKYSWPDKYFLKSSTFHLTEDVVLSNNLQMIASYFGDGTIITVNICLHGHSLTYNSSYAIDLAGDCTLNIYDCGGDDNHSGSIRGINVVNAATVNLYSGAIKDYTKDSGVSVYGKTGDKHATFNMYGGEISGNGLNAGSGGGGVGIGSDGVFNMYGGTITGNTVTKKDGGGVRVGDVSATFHMYGGTITNNTITFKETDSDTVVTWYDGAGVYNNGGTFTMQGNVNISGNVKGKPSALSANNVKVFYKVNSDGSPVKDYEGNILYDGKIKITGKLGAGSQIGMTMPADHLTGVITSGYTESGNTQNPSTFFNCDNSGYSISYDEDLGTEAAVYEGEVVVGNYTMTSAVAKSHVGTPKVGDTSIGLNIEVTLKNTDDNSTKTIQDVKTVPCSALKVGDNTVTYNYSYKGVTKSVSYVIHLDKVSAAVNWTCSGATSTGSNTAERVYDGSDALAGISASYLGYDGQTVTVSGSSLTVKKNGVTVNSATEVGVYSVSLPTSNIYDFSNPTFTLTITEAPIDEGYYTMRSATAVVNGTYTAGATSVSVTVTATLKNTVNANDTTTATENKQITVEALKAGSNNIKFTYVYTDSKGGTQSAQVTVTVNAAKKQTAVSWYFNGALASGNTAQFTSNGIDVLGDISAKYTDLSGKTVTVGGLSGDVVVKNSAGATVTSVVGAGVYTVSLAAKSDYTFTNNTFTLTVEEANVEDGYYKFKSAMTVGVVGTPAVGDKEIIVAVKVTLEHTKNHDIRENTVNTKVPLATALQVGDNNVTFTYEHTSAPDDVQSVQLSVTVTVANGGNVSDLTYEEDDEVVLGVSSDNGFEFGTEVVVERVNISNDVVNGQISSALSVTFVNNSTEVTPSGTITVRVLVPDDLVGKDYKIYNYNGGVATEVRFTVGGGYASFEADGLGTILFVTQDSVAPIGGNGAGIVLNNNGMVWVWVSVAIIASALAIMSVVIVLLVKRNKNK